MAYNNGFPMTYQQYYPQYQIVPQQQQQPQQQQVQQVQQQNGFIPVNSENEARMYPVAPGNSVTFIDENAPYCYVKTMGFSQLDRPKFEKYRLVKEEDATQMQLPEVEFAKKTELESLKNELKTMKEKLESFAREVNKNESVDEQ